MLAPKGLERLGSKHDKRSTGFTAFSANPVAV